LGLVTLDISNLKDLKIISINNKHTNTLKIYCHNIGEYEYLLITGYA